MPPISELVRKAVVLRHQWRIEATRVAAGDAEAASPDNPFIQAVPTGEESVGIVLTQGEGPVAITSPSANLIISPTATKPLSAATQSKSSSRNGPEPDEEDQYKALIRAAVARAKAADVVHHIAPLGRKRFETFEELEDFVTVHFARHAAGYRRRSSLSTLARNNQLLTARANAEAKGKIFAEGVELLPWNCRNKMFCVIYKCVHGCIQKSRGTGERSICSTRYTECQAQITGQLSFDLGPNNEKHWFVAVAHETVVHNHAVSNEVFETYNTTAMILADAELFKRIAWSCEMGGDPRLMRDHIGLATGSNYSQRKYDNLVRYWLGAAPVLRSVQHLLEAFAAIPGYLCQVMYGEGNVMVGIVMQSAVQRALVEAYGDTLVMDWTHNTNNRGMHLGALIATTAYGTSVSVLDFLCISQSAVMMTSVFEFFVEHNPRVKEKLQSLVIDKDVVEWKTAEAVLETKVVLCIFHVLKWFKVVVYKPKYEFDAATREDVLKCLRSMVFAVNADALEAQKTTLRLLLCPDEINRKPGHVAFLKFMEDRWYPHAEMWSYCKRCYVFTACNTTSNRVESWWNQFKATLGARRRLDLCIESIFQHATLVMRRERDLLATHQAKTRLSSGADKRLQHLLMELSPFCSKRVEKEWNKYLGRREKYQVVSDDVAVQTVRYYGAVEQDFAVDVPNGTCTCRAYMGSGLPCRHLLYVAHEHLHLSVFPITSVAVRWRLDAYLSMLPTISQSIDELAKLRIRQLVPDADQLTISPVLRAHVKKPDQLDTATPSVRVASERSIAHVHLARREICSSRVLDELQKRNECDVALEPIVAFSMGLSTPDFKDFMVDLKKTVEGFLARRRT